MAGFMIGPSGIAPPAAGGGGVVLTYQSGPASQGANNVFTFAAQPIGTAEAGRIVAVVCGARHNTSNTMSMTIGGVAATAALAGAVDDTTSFIDIFYANVPTGTTADVVVTVSTFGQQVQIAVYTITGASLTPSGTGSTAFTTVNPGSMVVTATVPSGGVGIAGFQTDRNVTTTWSNATLDFEQTGASVTEDIFALSTTSAGSITPTSAASAVTYYGAAMATWGP